MPSKNAKEYKYLCAYLLNGQPLYSPVLRISIINGSITFHTDALLDSGTDVTLVSEEVAKFLNIRREDCEKSDPVQGIVGSKADTFLANIKMVVEGFEDEPPIDMKVTFVTGLKTGVLLGRDDFFDNFEILFQNRKRVFKLTPVI